MIFKRNEVFTRVKEAVLADFPSVDVSAEYIVSPKTLPHVSIEMSDCYTPEDLQTQSLTEQYSVMMFTVNVYSNRQSGKMEECYNIMDTVDTAMRLMNARRLSLSPVPNLENASLGRLTARYQVCADKDTFYRR